MSFLSHPLPSVSETGFPSEIYLFNKTGRQCPSGMCLSTSLSAVPLGFCIGSGDLNSGSLCFTSRHFTTEWCLCSPPRPSVWLTIVHALWLLTPNTVTKPNVDFPLHSSPSCFILLVFSLTKLLHPYPFAPDSLEPSLSPTFFFF